MASVRLQKVLAHAGVSSRRAAEELMSAGRVRVDGRIVTELGTKVDPRGARVEVDGQRVVRQASVYLVLHKPRGVVSTMSDPEGRTTVRDLLREVSAARVYPVGRLDFNTSGALLVTNDGDFSVALMHPSKTVPKTYVVKVQGVMEDRELDRWRRGVDLEDGKTRPAKVKLLRYEGDKTWLELTITEGRNQQVRRMGDATGFRVMRLARMSFAGVGTEGLAPGRWRYLTADELATLKKDFGVPKRIVSPPKLDAAAATPAAGRVRPGAPPKRPRGPSGADSKRSKRPPSGGPRAGNRDSRSPQRSSGPRYGGGSPGRRGVDVREDWGGGIQRGGRGGEASRNEQAERSDSAPPRGDVGGRGGRTRTTGSGGGIGASAAGAGSYRVKGRRG
ncbi:MAG TPA: pseudouridine synthase [Polyangiaceae bacterium]|nr:pseudouridine synthase [Polyangiaceae bacterium]